MKKPVTMNTPAEQVAVEPALSVPERPSKLDPFAAKLSGWLKTEAGKSRKQRRTSKQLHDDLVTLGLMGGNQQRSLIEFTNIIRSFFQSAGCFSLDGKSIRPKPCS